jgi:hypothetical protein
MNDWDQLSSDDDEKEICACLLREKCFFDEDTPRFFFLEGKILVAPMNSSHSASVRLFRYSFTKEILSLSIASKADALNSGRIMKAVEN